MNPNRRHLIRTLVAGSVGGAWGAGGAVGTFGTFIGTARAAGPESARPAKVVVIGGGYGGATAAKYLRLFSGGTIDVVLVEPNERFVSCPLSNLVLAGERSLDDITMPYTKLASRHGVTLVRDLASAIDPQSKRVQLASGATLNYDKLVLAPGVDFQLDRIEGLRPAHDAGRVLHAWKAGPETVALGRQLQDMRNGGVFVISIPEAPYRCPPGPYERASLVAAYLKRHKPKSKVLVLDANPDLTSKGALFRKAWSDLYPGLIEYRPDSRVIAVDGRTLRCTLDFDEVQADVLNVLPPMRAGLLAVQTGLANANARWCSVDFSSFEATAASDIHVLGDSIQVASQMPKSGHMANSQAKVAAAAITARLAGLDIDPDPVLVNTCYSFVSADEAVHVASVHRWMAAEKTFVPVPGAGGLSSARSSQEGVYARAWADSIWADMLT